MKILIIKTSALGDIIHAFPCLQYLRSKFPEAQIDWVVEKGFTELVQAHPDINHVLCIDTKQWRKGLFGKENRQAIRTFLQKLRSVDYDIVFDLQGNIKSGLITYFSKGHFKVGFGSKTVPEWPNILFSHKRFNPPKGRNIRLDYLYIVQNYLKDLAPYHGEGVLLKLTKEDQILLDKATDMLKNMSGKKIMVCPGSAWPNKQMAPEELTTLLHQLQKKQKCASFVFVWGNSQEQLYAQDLQKQFADSSIVIDRVPLPVLQNLMATMHLVVAMDSLPLHLAGTTQVPTLSVFGPSLAAKYKPEGEQHISVQGTCPYGRTFEKRCPILRTCPTGACIHDKKINDAISKI